MFKICIVQQAEEIIQNIFSSFKSKLHELKWTDQKSLQLVMKKVTYGAKIVIVFVFLKLHSVVIVISIKASLPPGSVFNSKTLDYKRDL